MCRALWPSKRSSMVNILKLYGWINSIIYHANDKVLASIHDSLCVCLCVARPGEDLRVERCVKDPRSLSLPIMRSSSNTHSSSTDRAEHGSLGRREAADLLVGLVGHAAYIQKNGVSWHNALILFLFLIVLIRLNWKGPIVLHKLFCYSKCCWRTISLILWLFFFKHYN